MATFTMQFETGNDAFQGNVDAEIVRILRETADRIESGDSYNTFRNIKDINGNIVGVFALKEQR